MGVTIRATHQCDFDYALDKKPLQTQSNNSRSLGCDMHYSQLKQHLERDIYSHQTAQLDQSHKKRYRVFMTIQ